jgi:glycosyltransferase involved in cell wall biosynthesis
MKILYIAAEHVSGTLALFQQEHRRRGDECRYVTFWPSRWAFPDDICLNLSFMPDRSWVRALREAMLRLRGHGNHLPLTPQDPSWNPRPVERLLFDLRDFLNWPDIELAIRRYGLGHFDVIHLDGGLDFTRDARFVSDCRSRSKHVACFFHGTDLRNRGIVREVDQHVELRLTSEWDLLEYDPRVEYLYLPFDTTQYPDRVFHLHKPVRVCHASRNIFKGTEQIIAAVERLKQKHPVELILLRDLPHATALRIKNECDIFVDQLTNAGGWGYGMSSIEALAMGLPVVTNIPAKMNDQLGDQPFVQADMHTITDVLERLITNEYLCRAFSKAGQHWVRARHDVRTVGDQLYAYYQRLGWTAVR